MALMKNAKTFGVAWLGDGATIKCIPLLNILQCVERSLQLLSPSLIVVTTCHKGEKDAWYIRQLFKDKIAEFDPTLFKGVRNVKKL